MDSPAIPEPERLRERLPLSLVGGTFASTDRTSDCQKKVRFVILAPEGDRTLELQAELVMRLTVRIEEPLSVGDTGQGRLVIIPIVGGHFEGPRIRGTVCHGGADWNTRIDETRAHVLARYWLRTDDGEIIAIRNEGLIDLSEMETTVAKTTPSFQVDRDGPYGFLAVGVFVGELRPGGDSSEVEIAVHRMK